MEGFKTAEGFVVIATDTARALMQSGVLQYTDHLNRELWGLDETQAQALRFLNYQNVLRNTGRRPEHIAPPRDREAFVEQMRNPQLPRLLSTDITRRDYYLIIAPDALPIVTALATARNTHQHLTYIGAVYLNWWSLYWRRAARLALVTDSQLYGTPQPGAEMVPTRARNVIADLRSILPADPYFARITREFLENIDIAPIPPHFLHAKSSILRALAREKGCDVSLIEKTICRLPKLSV